MTICNSRKQLPTAVAGCLSALVVTMTLSRAASAQECSGSDVLELPGGCSVLVANGTIAKVGDDPTSKPKFSATLILEPPATPVATSSSGEPTQEWEIRPLDDMIASYVAAAVKATDGNVRKAARKLQISPSTLYARMKK